MGYSNLNQEATEAPSTYRIKEFHDNCKIFSRMTSRLNMCIELYLIDPYFYDAMHLIFSFKKNYAHNNINR